MKRILGGLFLLLSCATHAQVSDCHEPPKPAPFANNIVSAYTNPIYVQWAPPTQRENCNPITTQEIKGYWIRARSKDNTTTWESQLISPGSATNLLFTVPSSVLTTINRFEIAVEDTNGLYSGYVTIIPKPYVDPAPVKKPAAPTGGYID